MNADTVRAYERQIVGCFLGNPETIGASGLVAEDFSTTWARRSVEALLRISLNGDPVTLPLVAELSGSNIGDLAAAEDEACLPAQLAFYAREVRAAAFRRRLIATCSSAVERLSRANGIDPTADVAAELAAAIDQTPGTERPRSLEELAADLIAELPARKERGRPGYSTGFPTIDRLIGGLRPGSLFVIAAGTGVGKSLLAVNIALGAKIPTAMFSLEMSGLEVAERLIAAAAGVSATRIQRGIVSDSEIPAMADAAHDYRGIWIDDRPAPSVLEIAATARALHRRESARLVIVDYLQIVRATQDERREAEVAAIARGLRALARQLNVPVIALAQLNRDGQVRDSAVIEHEAHVVGVFERKKGSEAATLEIRKNRHGPEDCVAMHFDRTTLRLREVDR